MTTLDNRPNTALLVVDMQRLVLDDAYNRDVVVANISEVVDKARSASIDIVSVQHTADHLPRGSDGHTTSDLSDYGAPPPDQVIAHTNLYWSYQEAPGRSADTIAAGDVVFPGRRP